VFVNIDGKWRKLAEMRATGRLREKLRRFETQVGKFDERSFSAVLIGLRLQKRDLKVCLSLKVDNCQKQQDEHKSEKIREAADLMDLWRL
jgi:hypothetical protein